MVDELRAEKILQERLLNHPKIEPLWFNELKEVIGTDNPKGVEAVRVEKHRRNNRDTLQRCFYSNRSLSSIGVS